MSLLRKILLAFFLLFPISNSYGEIVTHVQTVTFEDGPYISPEISHASGIEFNKDGTKMFVSHATVPAAETYQAIYEYNLSTPYNTSTRTYAEDSERCTLGDGTNGIPTDATLYDLEFSSDGMKLFTTSRIAASGMDKDKVYRFDLTSPYDVSTCEYVQETTDLDQATYNNGSNAGNFIYSGGFRKKNRLQGIEINNDGTKLFLVWMDAEDANTRLLEYKLTTPYDVTTLQLVTTAGIGIGSTTTANVINPNGMRFSSNGKRIFVISHQASGSQGVSQISLTNAYDTSSYTLDGKYSFFTSSPTNTQPRGVAFSASGLKMYIGSDASGDYTAIGSRVYEYDLVCPFSIFSGTCPSITDNSDRTGMAEAQVELAKRSITLSTNSALNRLKWIRRNKDKQNLSNQNVKLNFSNSMLSSLEALPISSFKKISTSKNNNDSNKNYFYWSEGSVSLGRVGDTSIASTKEVHTNSLTFGYDRFTDDYGISGLAFRYGNDDVDVGSAGSNLSSNTYNITYYSTSPVKDDTKYVDKIFGIGKIRSDILTVLDGKNLTADRTGNQIYGTVKIKDEYKKNNLILIPSGQFDFGHTILNGYQEAGTGAIIVEDQHVRTKKLRATIAIVEDLSNDKYEFKRHGKLEYMADIDRSSNFKYRYVSDRTKSFNDTLHTGALHNLNGEIGFDIIFPEHYSIFVIYERNHAFGSGYTDNIYIALGYLPNKDTEYAFSVNGSENLMSQFKIKKNINGFDLSFNLNDDLTNLGKNKEANINLNKVF